MAYADISSVDGTQRLTVATAWTEKELIKTVPGKRWHADLRVWHFPVSWATCRILRGVFGKSLVIGDALRAWAWNDRNDRIMPALNLRMMTEPLDPAADLDGLYPFQHVGVDFLNIAGNALLGDDMGTGKTVQLLRALRHEQFPALVICPNGVKSQWAEAAARWLPEVTPVVIGGSAAIKRRLLTGPAALAPNALVIINIEAVRLHSRLAPYGSVRLARCRDCDKKHGAPGLSASRCEVHHKELNDIPFRTVILDEAHRIKDPSSKQTRAVWAVSHQDSVQRRWAATGTPVANDPSDLWSIMHFVSPTEYPSKGQYVDRYCLMGWTNDGGSTVVGINPASRDEFFSILDPRYRRMPKALVLPQLPPKVRVIRTVSMSPKQAKAYKEVESSLLTQLDDGSLLVAPNDLVAQIRLLQLASSYCEIEHTGEYDEFGREKLKVWLREPSPKIDELMLILEELLPEGRQVAVSAESRQLIMLASARLDKIGIKHSMIVGGLTQFERDHQLARFQDGTNRVMLFTLKAGGTGLNMQAADTMVCLQRSWSLIDNYQGEDRIHRIGSERHDSVTIIDVVTDNTIEASAQIPRLMDKMTRLEEITRDRATLISAGVSTGDLDHEWTKLMQANLGRA
jgi:SNF2 family DNA or RNA helicase